MSPHRILHLSDTHATATGFDAFGVNAAAALDQILRDCRHLPGLDLVVVSGDIADDGSAEGCALVRDRVGQFAAGRGIPHVYTTGNHDRRPGFTAALGSGHRAETRMWACSSTASTPTAPPSAWSKACG